MRNLITWRRWTVILLILLAIGAVFVPGAAAQSDNIPRLTVTIEALNVRDGPDTTYPIIGLLVQGDEVWRVIGDQRLNGEEPRLWNNVAPAWSPDGSQIAFLTDRIGQWEIWVMNADGSDQRPLFPAGTLDGLTLQYNGVDERALSWR